MSSFIDLTGQRFGRLTVISRAESYRQPSGVLVTKWNCLCDCGNVVAVRMQNLRRGITKSCGCLQKEKAKEIGAGGAKTNKYDLSGNYGIGYTSNNDYFYFDLEDYEKIKEYCWYSYDGYIRTKNKGDEKLIALHRIIMSPPKDKVIDHINHNPRDNRKNNLRICTQSENMMNTSMRVDNKSGKIGVSYSEKDNKWHAQIKINKKKINKSFKTKEEAIEERIKLEKIYYGEFANKEKQI